MRRWRPPLVAAAELLAEETKVFERLLALCVEHSLPPQIPRFIAKEDHGVERLARHASRRAAQLTDCEQSRGGQEPLDLPYKELKDDNTLTRR